jgi:hypothetical protein
MSAPDWLEEIELRGVVENYEKPPKKGKKVGRKPLEEVHSADKGRLGVKDRIKNKRSAESRRKARERYRRWYQKNKEEVHRKKRMRYNTPRGAFYHARASAKARGEEWEMELEEWYQVWEEAPDVFDDRVGYVRRPFAMRGRSPYKNTQLCRVDTSKPWAYDNVEIRYKLQPLPEDSSPVPDWDVVRGAPEIDIEEQG